ncbi:MAG: rod shape-determining protein MreD [Desulfuromonadaceae bacterium]|nr:rod shape-determining protein MreD [Desulfuromonadaceae bacterium]MDD2855422.1 rod shape-determining protein MreD [Desulfuromonadaceae bacterium]
MNRTVALLFFSIVLSSIVIQVSLLPLFLRPSFKPDFLLVIMVFIALRGSLQSGAPLAWLLGMLDDVFSGMYLGLNAFTFLISFIVIKSVSDRLYADSGILFILTVSMVTAAGFVINLLLTVMFVSSPGIAYSMLSDIIPRILINAFVASIVTLFPLFDSQVEAK